jgi:hypothetical protein
MGTGMAEILPFEIDLGATELLRQTLGKIERGLPAGIFVEITVKLTAKSGVAPNPSIGLFQFNQGRHERL